MFSSEEEWLDKLSIIDSVGVWHDHLRTLVFSMLFFGFYGLFILIICSSSPTLMSIALLFGSQTLVGLLASRGYSDFGVLAREKLRLYDPNVGNSEPQKVTIDPGNISVVFERFALQAQKVDITRTDDLIDLSWFLVLAWSILSSTLFALGLTQSLFCSILGDLALIAACILSYFCGYRTQRGLSLEDQLTHLEYHLMTRLRAIGNGSKRGSHSTSLLLRQRFRRLYIMDVIVEFDTAPGLELDYRIGVPSSENERFVLDAPDEKAAMVKHHLEALSLFKLKRWTVEEMKTQKSKILRAINTKPFDLSNPTTFVQGPELLDEEAKEARAVLEVILKGIAQS